MLRWRRGARAVLLTGLCVAQSVLGCCTQPVPCFRHAGFSEILGNAFQKHFCGAWTGRGSSEFFFPVAHELHPTKDGGEAASLAP